MIVGLIKFLLFVGGPLALDIHFGDKLSAFFPPSTGFIPRAYGLVILVNVVASSFMILSLGFKVGAARKKYGVSLPNMYACEKRTDNDAKMFNALQRGHQQALETYQKFLVFSIIGGLKHPYATTAAGVLYVISRLRWAAGYATGDPQKRYEYSLWGKHIWTSLIIPLITTVSFALTVLGVLQ